ncbi:MAG TPA: hypothetical protein VNB94_12345 [Mycobacteriales bacterium]|nr:hypothetical protein [Mycobacteriales bacterium]
MRYTRWALCIGIAALALNGCRGSEEPTPGSAPSPSPSTSVPTAVAPSASPGRSVVLEVRNGRVTRDAGRVRLRRGETVRLVVSADVADEVHVHGYDIRADVVPGTPTEVVVELTIPGVFAVELEGAGLDLVELEVR